MLEPGPIPILDAEFTPGAVEPPPPVGPTPTLADLQEEPRQRLVRFIVTSTLGGGVAPTEVIALYADLAGDTEAIRYADQRFMLRQMPPDWRDVEDRVSDLDESARARGVDLAAAWRRALSVAVDLGAEDPLERLARLAGSPSGGSIRAARSIFDDPEDLDALEDEADEALRHPLEGRLPDLVDLARSAQARIRRFGIEERLEHGLPPIELLELYRAFELAEDDRARQYLDRIFVEREPPPDWLDLQAEAGKVMDLAAARGRDAGRLFAAVVGSSAELDPLVALHMVAERLLLGVT